MTTTISLTDNENGLTTPTTRLQIYFGGHDEGTVADVEKLREPIAWADVILLELGVNPVSARKPKRVADTEEQYLNELASGNVNPDEWSSAFGAARNRLLYNCKKIIYIERSPLQRSVSNQTTHGIRQFAKWLRKMNEEDQKRDTAYAELIAKTLRQHSDKNILVIRGTAHRHYLPKALDKLGIKFEQHLYSDPTVDDALIKKVAAGQKPSKAELVAAIEETQRYWAAVRSRGQAD